MGKNAFANPIFHDEAAAREWFEKTRWPFGPTCPKCSTTERKPYATKKAGVYRCERGGSVRSFPIPYASLDSVVGLVRENIARKSRLQTDETKLYV